jgi:Sigma-70, region 4
MSALDNLAPDQRAVLQMVLQRGRSYDEIAGLLSIDPAAVRQRALDAFDALTPATVLPGPERALVTDYLLRQLPDRVAEQVYAFLQASDADRAWAEALAEVVGPLTSASLPEIPVGAPLGADDWAGGALEQDSDPPDPGDAEPYYAPVADQTVTDQPDVRTSTREPRPPGEPRPSSRRGGAILLGTIAVLIVAVIVVVLATSGGGKKSPASSGHTNTANTTTPTSSTATTGTTSTAATTQILTQLNLSSPTGAKGTLGIVQVIRVDGVVGVALDAQGLPPNTAHNAYAVWLYNSASSFKFVGFVQTRVGKSGKVATEGTLPSGASSYHRLLITLETQQKPTRPGEVVLSGRFRE